ncbi:unnamed protein product [Sphagnum balticum]
MNDDSEASTSSATNHSAAYDSNPMVRQIRDASYHAATALVEVVSIEHQFRVVAMSGTDCALAAALVVADVWAGGGSSLAGRGVPDVCLLGCAAAAAAALLPSMCHLRVSRLFVRRHTV